MMSMIMIIIQIIVKSTRSIGYDADMDKDFDAGGSRSGSRTADDVEEEKDWGSGMKQWFDKYNQDLSEVQTQINN